MLVRPILSRTLKHHGAASFCILNNGGTALEKATSSKEKPLEKGYVISYLVKSYGLSAEDAVSVSQKVHFDGPDKPNAILKFFQKQGFTKTQIAHLVTRHPQVLLANPETSLLPKIQFFLQSVGISEKDALAALSRRPYLLTRSVHKFAPIYDYLSNVIGSARAQALLLRGSWVFHHDLENRLIPNVDFLRNLGVPPRSVEFALSSCPEIFWPGHEEFVEVVDEVKQMGFDLTKSTFVLAIHVRSEKGNLALWDQCFQVYTQWGWSKDDILMAFRKHPNCMLLSGRKISNFLGFLANEMGRESRLVAGCPYVIFYSMEKRIVPRCAVVRVLLSKGLIKKDWSLTGVFCPADRVFLQKYVTKYAQELPQLCDIYQANIGSSTLKSSEQASSTIRDADS